MTLVHRNAHDYPRLIRRWRRAAKASGLIVRGLCDVGGHPLFYLEAARPRAGAPAVYFSAGIHGDEPASTEALLTWTEKNERLLQKIRPLIFPCLNPWGLVNNSRLDKEGRDLNRCFNAGDVPQIAAQARVMAGRRFDLALTLHEDYDARGVYIYEIAGRRPYLGEKLIRAASRHIPAETRTRIEGRRARGGIVRRRITPELMPDWPEAFVLHFRHAGRTFTVETPSEFHLDDRVAAQIAVIDLAVKSCLEEAARLVGPARKDCFPIVF